MMKRAIQTYPTTTYLSRVTQDFVLLSHFYKGRVGVEAAEGSEKRIFITQFCPPCLEATTIIPTVKMSELSFYLLRRLQSYQILLHGGQIL